MKKIIIQFICIIMLLIIGCQKQECKCKDLRNQEIKWVNQVKDIPIVKLRKGESFTANGDGIFFEEDGSLTRVQEDTIVSMNLMGFSPSFFRHLESYVETFIRMHSQDLKKEALLPTVVNEVVHAGKARVKILPTNSSWFGVTYQEDKKIVKHKVI